MKNKVVLITGATSGIGKQSAISLAETGASVIVTGRNRKSGEEAVDEIKSISKNQHVELLLADISTIAGINQLVNGFKSNHPVLDVLINNAGLAARDNQKTADGFDANFAVNVVAPFLLTTLLMSNLAASESARVITLTGGDLPSKLDLNNIQNEISFKGLSSYSQSKMIMMCLMYEYSQRLEHKNITINICYPGQAGTHMTQSVTADMLPLFMKPFFPLFKWFVRPDNGQSAKKASRSTVFLAGSQAVEHKTGLYYDKNVKLVPIPAAVTDIKNRQYIWDYVFRQLAGKVDKAYLPVR